MLFKLVFLSFSRVRRVGPFVHVKVLGASCSCSLCGALRSRYGIFVVLCACLCVCVCCARVGVLHFSLSSDCCCAMANGRTMAKDNKRRLFETPSGCHVCDGPPGIYKALGEWPCAKPGCGASNRPQNAFCFKKCGGKPDLEFMGKQAEVQQKHDQRTKICQPPYVPPGRRI